MAYSRLLTAKDGRLYYKIEVSRGRGKSYLSHRWYVPEGWSKRAIERELRNQEAEFERKVKAGEIVSRAEAKAVAEAEAKAKAEAEAAAAAEAEKLKTLEQYITGVFMPIKELSVAENTRRSYWTNLNEHVLPYFGAVPMIEITSAMISARLLDFQKTHSYASAIKLYNLLSGVFKMGFMDDTLSSNPMHKVARPRQRKDDRAFSEADKALFADELNYVLDCAKNEPLKWQVYLYLAADTGARRGEISGLQWADIDLKNGYVTIRRNLQYSRDKKTETNDNSVIYDGVYVVAPKGGRFRTVDIGTDCVALLNKYKAELLKPDEVINFSEAVKPGAEKKEKKLPKWLFTIDGADLPMHPTTPTYFFRKFGDRYNIPGFHPHMLRHTSATLSLTNGGDPKSTADRLGHKDASVLMKVYAHADDESIRRAGAAARDALKRKREADKKDITNA